MTDSTQTVANTALPRTAAPSPEVIPAPMRRRGPGRATAKLPASFSFYDGSVSQDGTIASIGKPYASEIDAQKACARSGKPYLKIETLRVDFAVVDGKLVAVATPAKKQ